MDTSHAPLLARQDHEPVGSLVIRALRKEAVKLPSNPLFWATLGSMAVSLLFRAPLGRRVRGTVGRLAVPFVFLGIYNRLKARRETGYSAAVGR
jgi:hypothetical protein